MIIASILELYEQLKAEGRVPRPNFTFENISGEVVLDAAGKVVEVNSFVRDLPKGQFCPKMDVPAFVGRTSGIEANRLWDKTAYLCGATAKLDKKKKPIRDKAGQKQPCQDYRAEEKFAAFVRRHAETYGDSSDAGLVAVSLFLKSWNPKDYLSVFPDDLLDTQLVFRLQGDTHADGKPRFIHERPAAIAPLAGSESVLDEDRVCAVTGVTGPCIRKHPLIKGVKGGQASGVSLSSFNVESSRSYGLDGAHNGPVSVDVATKVAAALNVLLDKDSAQKVVFGDVTVVFWVKKDREDTQDFTFDLEDVFFRGAGGGMPNQTSQVQAQSFFEAIRQGHINEASFRGMRLCVLGLSASDARLRIQSFSEDAPLKMISNIVKHQEALAIEGLKFTPRPWDILGAIARKNAKGDPLRDELPPHIGRDLRRAILEGTPYPQALLFAALQRIGAEANETKITPTRIAILKAVISRMPRQKAIPMTNDPEFDVPAYQLGRLFAIFENMQRLARPEVKRTIRETSMSAASTTPAIIFPDLLRRAQIDAVLLHKQGKGGLAVFLDRQAMEITKKMGGTYPRMLKPIDQGYFFSGYYQQSHAPAKPAPTQTDTATQNDTATLQMEQTQ